MVDLRKRIIEARKTRRVWLALNDDVRLYAGKYVIADNVSKVVESMLLSLWEAGASN